jgi:hypothetical protein
MVRSAKRGRRLIAETAPLWQPVRRSAPRRTTHKRGAQLQRRSHLNAITERADNLPHTQTFKISAQSCKFAEVVRISSQTKMLPNHISIVRERPLGRIDNVALKRSAQFTVE